MTIPFEDRPYRPCVGVMLLNRDNLVFAAQRIDQEVEAWQMPQGGIDEGEEPLVDVVPVDAEAFHDLEVAGFAVDDVDVMAGGPQGGREGLDDFGAVDFSVKRRDGDEKRRGPL